MERTIKNTPDLIHDDLIAGKDLPLRTQGVYSQPSIATTQSK